MHGLYFSKTKTHNVFQNSEATLQLQNKKLNPLIMSPENGNSKTAAPPSYTAVRLFIRTRPDQSGRAGVKSDTQILKSFNSLDCFNAVFIGTESRESEETLTVRSET